MKRIIFFHACFWALTAFSCPSTPAFSDNPISPDLQSSIEDLFQVLQDKDVATFQDQYIHPTYGMYDVYRPGAMGVFRLMDSVSFSKEDSYTNLYPKLFCIDSADSLGKLEWHDPRYICDVSTWEWEKEGYFVSDKPLRPSIPFMMIMRELDGDASYSEEEKRHANWILGCSYRVVFTKYDLSFFLTKIDGRWYVTLLDRITSDCSA
ncbi:MAG: hypothetical protein AAF587_40540 [Bacteroidota bacterium]